MAAPQMVKKIHDLSQILNQALQMTHPADLADTINADKDQSSYLFEVKVLFSLLDWLTKNGWNVQVENLQSQNHQPVIALPRSPGLKKNFSYFRIKNKQTGDEWQLVPGTKVTDESDETHAPDLSLQVSTAGFNPECGDVKAMWDSKFHGEEDILSDVTLTREQFAKFVLDRDDLQVPRPNSQEDPLSHWPPAFEVSGLITNGQAHTAKPKIFLKHGVSVTRHFQDATTETWPRRTSHN